MLSSLTITVEPIATRPGYFLGRVGPHVVKSREPLLAGARALLKAGVPAESIIQMKRVGFNIIAMSSTVGAAARMTTYEDADEPPRFRTFKTRQDAPPCREGSPRIAQTTSTKEFTAAV